MDKDIKAFWVDALRSGKYKQGKSFLSYDKKFCCLGVLCDVMAHPLWEHDWDCAAQIMLDDPWEIPPELRKKCKITRREQTKLIDLNDEENKTFPEIADWIEENL